MNRYLENRARQAMWGKARRIHFVGIGGAGMSGIAEVLINLGYQVTGSDLKESEVSKRLAELGGRIFYGHRPEQVGDAEVVVISSAVREDNPEVLEARRRKILVIPRAEMLAELMRLKHSIAVAGSHGKTTTTSMIATILHQAGLDPTAVIGGKLDSFGSGARLGTGDLMVVEADESDGSFLKLRPVIAVVTNVDREHLDHYGTFESLQASFLRFANEVPFYGLCVICTDCQVLRGMAGAIERRYVTYGVANDAEFRAVEIAQEKSGCGFDVIHQGRKLGRIVLGVPGRHNAVNALAAIAVAFELGVDYETAAKALANFKGVNRRFQVKGEAGGVTVVDDYGHHPTEIQATLAAASDWRPEKGGQLPGRIVCGFQPHRYTRTKILGEEFAAAFDQAQVLVVTEIYSAGEEPIAGVSGRTLFDRIALHRSARGLETLFCATLAEMESALEKLLKPGDLFITVGAGNIWQAGEEVLKRISKRIGTKVPRAKEGK